MNYKHVILLQILLIIINFFIINYIVLLIINYIIVANIFCFKLKLGIRF